MESLDSTHFDLWSIFAEIRAALTWEWRCPGPDHNCGCPLCRLDPFGEGFIWSPWTGDED